MRTTLLSKNIILSENNTCILGKKLGRRTLRESNDSVKHYIYILLKKKLGEGRNASSRFTTCAIPTFLPVALEISTLCFYLAESLAVRIKIHWAGFLPGKFSSWRMKVSSWRTVSRNPWSCQCPVKRFLHRHLQHD